jgi:hypothetical protein
MEEQKNVVLAHTILEKAGSVSTGLSLSKKQVSFIWL